MWCGWIVWGIRIELQIKREKNTIDEEITKWFRLYGVLMSLLFSNFCFVLFVWSEAGEYWEISTHQLQHFFVRPGAIYCFIGWLFSAFAFPSIESNASGWKNYWILVIQYGLQAVGSSNRHQHISYGSTSSSFSLSLFLTLSLWNRFPFVRFE